MIVTGCVFLGEIMHAINTHYYYYYYYIICLDSKKNVDRDFGSQRRFSRSFQAANSTNSYCVFQLNTDTHEVFILGAIQVLRNAFFLEIRYPPTPS